LATEIVNLRTNSQTILDEQGNVTNNNEELGESVDDIEENVEEDKNEKK